MVLSTRHTLCLIAKFHLLTIPPAQPLHIRFVFRSPFNLLTSFVAERDHSSSVRQVVFLVEALLGSHCQLLILLLCVLQSLQHIIFWLRLFTRLIKASWKIPSSSKRDNFTVAVVSSTTTCTLATSQVSWSFPSMSCLVSSAEPAVWSSKL